MQLPYALFIMIQIAVVVWTIRSVGAEIIAAIKELNETIKSSKK